MLVVDSVISLVRRGVVITLTWLEGKIERQDPGDDARAVDV